MKVSGVERSTEAEDTESDDLGGKEVFVGNVSGESATENSPIKSVPKFLQANPSTCLLNPAEVGGRTG